MYLEEHRLVEAKLDTFDVNGVSGNGNTIPTSSHGAVRTAPSLLQAPGLGLNSTGSHGGLLENGTKALASLHSISKHLVISIVTGLAREVVELPVLNIHVGLDPLIHAVEIWLHDQRKQKTK